MDQFSFHLPAGDRTIYRWAYPFINANMFVVLTGEEAVVFDPHENAELLELLQEKGIRCVHILLTHEHYDHVSGVNWLKEKTGATLFCQEQAAAFLAEEHRRTPAFISMVIAYQDRKDGGHRYQDFKAQFKPYRIEADRTFSSADCFRIGELQFEVTATPGHSPGSACYRMNGRLVFTGDTLLQYGRVILGFRESQRAEYEERALPYLRSLPKDTIIMPGHGDPFVLRDTKNI